VAPLDVSTSRFLGAKRRGDPGDCWPAAVALDRHASLAMTTLPGADDALRQSLFRVEIASDELDSADQGKYDADNQYYNCDPNKQVSAAHGGRGDPAEPE
jgi:hypothetical protein